MKNILVMFILLLASCVSTSAFASGKDYRLHIHVHYQKEIDTWKVDYEMPIAVEHVAFLRRGNFEPSKLYKIDETKFKWDRAGDVRLIRSIDGTKFTSLTIRFSSDYTFIQKDYTHNVKYSDGSVMLYTNHLALGANIIEDKGVSPVGASFEGTRFHFYSPDNHIVFLGQRFKDKAEWRLEGEGTYIYFGNIAPIENDNMIAIVDPALPQWAWDKTLKNFPKLFDYYASKTEQILNFKPVVFFNYDDIDGDYSNYSGGTLDGLVQLTINGKRWRNENEQLYNRLFHFLAHEAAHFWNGQMFTFEDQLHSWMHEGGADTFANFAMQDFGLINEAEMLQKFEDAANKCFLNKSNESLEQSGELWRYRNYYDCGAAMGLASHFAVKGEDPNKSIFDVWKHIFAANLSDRMYGQQDYFDALNDLTASGTLSIAFEKFSSQTDLDNQAEIASWFKASGVSAHYSDQYPVAVVRHWGQQIFRNLMSSHCKRISFSSYEEYVETYPIDGCKVFEQGMKVQFVDGLDIFQDGVNAYQLFKEKCDKGESVTLQNREKVAVAQLECIRKVQSAQPYMMLQMHK